MSQILERSEEANCNKNFQTSLNNDQYNSTENKWQFTPKKNHTVPVCSPKCIWQFAFSFLKKKQKKHQTHCMPS